MPGKRFYSQYPLTHDKIRAFVDHHFDRKTRHISKDEAEMLMDAADELERVEP